MLIVKSKTADASRSKIVFLSTQRSYIMWPGELTNSVSQVNSAHHYRL